MKVRLDLDPDSLEVGEIMDIEEVTGQPFGILEKGFRTGEWSMASVAAFIWIAERRKNPEFTFEDAKKVKFGDVELTDSPDEPSSELGSNDGGDVLVLPNDPQPVQEADAQ